uniref:DUF1639 domain-containing protein n=1 Tax=Ananas comosus var. bracteatus TaxID=296719 RepID=A0A6V7QSH4_ANACO
MEKNHYHTRGSTRVGVAGFINANGVSEDPSSLTEPDLPLQWGNRKRSRCVKTLRKDAADKIRADHRLPRPDNSNLLLRHTSSPSPCHPRNLRNTEATATMRAAGGHQQPAAAAAAAAEQRRSESWGSVGVAGSGEGGVVGGEEGFVVGERGAVWPKFAIALTNKEKEEDFLAFKGSKLPQRPKKRAKIIQRTLNLVSPGAWLCDLTLERYEVREKKISKKRPRGLKAMQNMESDSD